MDPIEVIALIIEALRLAAIWPWPRSYDHHTMDGFSIINLTTKTTAPRSTLAEALEAITAPTDFVGADDRWEIVKLPSGRVGAAGAFIKSEGEPSHGPISSARAAELLGART